MILAIFGLIYFGEGYMLAFASSYVVTGLNLSDIGPRLIFFFYTGSLIAKFIGAALFQCVKFWIVACLTQCFMLLFGASLVATQIVWDKGDSDVVDEWTMNLILFALFGLIGAFRALSSQSTFGLVAPVHPVTALVATGDMIVFACGFAVGGYGVGTVLQNFGYSLYPYLGVLSNLVIIAMMFVMIPFHNKIVKNNESEIKQSS